MSQLFEITIHPKGVDSWPVTVQIESEATIAATRHTGRLALEPAVLRAQTRPQAYGEILGKALFQGQVREAFVEAVAMSQGKLHIRLFIEDVALRTLHWEWLCAPRAATWSMLALDQSLPTAFYLPSSNSHVFRPITQTDLQALVVVANPDGLAEYDLAPFDEQATISGVQAALKTLPTTVLATTPAAAGLPTLDNLAEQLTATPFNLLHLVCHGRVAKQAGETLLYLAGAAGRVAPVRAGDLIARLGSLRQRPYFIFLSTCESAAPEAEGAMGGLAQRLVLDLGIPAVLAMTARGTVPTATALASPPLPRIEPLASSRTD